MSTYHDQQKKNEFRRGAVVFVVSLSVLVALGVGLSKIQRGSSPETETVASSEPVSSRTWTPTTATEPVISTESSVREQEASVETTGIETSGFLGEEVETQAVRYEEAEGLYRDRDYEGAFDLFTVYVEQNPENPWGYYMRGLSAWKGGWLEEAEESFETAIELDDDHVKSHLNLVRVLLDGSRATDALPVALRAVEIDETNGEAYRLLGRVHHNQGDVESAIASYRQAVALDEEDVWAMNNLGLLFIERERFGEALFPLARAVQIRDDVVVFQNNLGIALERTGHYESAVEAFEAALRVDESNSRILANLERVDDLVSVDSGFAELDSLAEQFRGTFTAPETDLTKVGP